MSLHSCSHGKWVASECVALWLQFGQVMVLTHEDATEEEKMPYMAVRCHPMVVKEFYGRAAKRDPPCPASECIWWWWKDVRHSIGCSSVLQCMM